MLIFKGKIRCSKRSCRSLRREYGIRPTIIVREMLFAICILLENFEYSCDFVENFFSSSIDDTVRSIRYCIYVDCYFCRPLLMREDSESFAKFPLRMWRN